MLHIFCDLNIYAKFIQMYYFRSSMCINEERIKCGNKQIIHTEI
jgi:hypothetical protein